jgi:hypothetical protein
VDVERAEQPVAQALDGRHRRLEAVDQPGPRLADGVLDAEPGQAQRREGIAMRCQRPADETDAPAEGDDRGKDVVARPAVERTLVELVDLALDPLDQQEVPDQHLVDQRRDQITRRQVAESCLAIQPISEPFQGLHSTLMDGQYHVATRQQIDLPPDEPRGVRVVGLHRFERDVQEVAGAGQPRSPVVGLEARDVGVGQPERLEALSDPVRLSARIDVHPQELFGAEGPYDLLGQLDPPVLCVRIEEADGDVAQCRLLRSPAAAAQMKATTYCSASMVRSWGGSTSHDPDGLVVRSNSIDVGPHSDDQDRRHRAGHHHATGSACRA